MFDVKVLLDNEGITDEILVFLVYLAGHDEAISNLLVSKKRDDR